MIRTPMIPMLYPCIPKKKAYKRLQRIWKRDPLATAGLILPGFTIYLWLRGKPLRH